MIHTPKKKFVMQTAAKEKELVLFDFDGTLTTHDTLGEFMKFYHGKAKYYGGLALLSPVMAMYVTKTIANWKAKQFFLRWFLKGESEEHFNDKCRQFVRDVVPGLLRQGALKAIQDYQRRGARIAIVSASAENWVKPFCDSLGVECLATRLEVKAGKITGKIAGRNCHGPEKVSRVKEKFDLSAFDKVIAYGDTSGDREMLDLAAEKHYKPFRS